MKADYHYSYSEEELNKDWQRLIATTEYKTGAQFKPGLKLCQQFFPNFFLIEDKNGKSFAKCWKDEEVMKKVLKWANSGDGSEHGMSHLWLSWVKACCIPCRRATKFDLLPSAFCKADH